MFQCPSQSAHQLLFWDSCTGLTSLPAAKTHTLSCTHRNVSLRSSPLWLLYLIPLFWIFSVRVRVSTCVCVRQNPPLRTPTFLAPPRQAGREWWLKLKMSLYFSLFLFLTLNQKSRSASPCRVYLSVHLLVKVINSDSDLNRWYKICDFQRVGSPVLLICSGLHDSGTFGLQDVLCV